METTITTATIITNGGQKKKKEVNGVFSGKIDQYYELVLCTRKNKQT